MADLDTLKSRVEHARRAKAAATDYEADTVAVLQKACPHAIMSSRLLGETVFTANRRVVERRVRHVFCNFCEKTMYTENVDFQP